MLLSARWVVPVASPPIENGAVLIQDGRIQAVGPVRTFSEKPKSLGDVALYPGLVNTHCHLEFSHVKGKTTPDKPFTEWVKEMARVGAQFIAPESVDRLIQTGTTTVADHCSPETPPIETPLRRLPYWEVLGSAKDRAEASLEMAGQRAASEGGFVTPHSFYAVHPQVLDQTLKFPHPLSIHFLESADEDAFFRRGSGPLADYVVERGGIVSKIPPTKNVPENALLIHANHLEKAEIEALHAQNATVIHCPGSHKFFGHRRFPYEALRAAGVRVALGTDSLASNEDLSMLREMRLFMENYPEAGREEVLQMATLDGARALGMEKDIGSIEVGKKADLIAVRGDIFKAESVAFSMIGGREILNV